MVNKTDHSIHDRSKAIPYPSSFDYREFYWNMTYYNTIGDLSETNYLENYAYDKSLNKNIQED